MIKSIAHAALFCADIERSLNFYCEILGLKRAFELEKDGKPYLFYLKVADGQFIELFFAREGMLPFSRKNCSFAHLCLEVEDIEAACAAITAKGYPLTQQPKQGMDSNWQAWLDDPDGNPIELMQINPESPQAKA